MKRKKGYITSSAIAALLFGSSCSSVVGERMFAREEGMVTLHADAAGLDAFGNMLTGLVNETKTPEGQEGAYWQHEKEKTRSRAMRFRVYKPTTKGK